MEVGEEYLLESIENHVAMLLLFVSFVSRFAKEVELTEKFLNILLE